MINIHISGLLDIMWRWRGKRRERGIICTDYRRSITINRHIDTVHMKWQHRMFITNIVTLLDNQSQSKKSEFM